MLKHNLGSGGKTGLPNLMTDESSNGASGQSFCSKDGISWLDIGASKNTNCRIKAYTNKVEEIKVAAIILNKTNATLKVNETTGLTETVSPTDATNKLVG